MRWVSRLTTVAVIVAIVAAIGRGMRAQIPDAEIGQSFRTHAKFREGS